MAAGSRRAELGLLIQVIAGHRECTGDCATLMLVECRPSRCEALSGAW